MKRVLLAFALQWLALCQVAAQEQVATILPTAPRNGDSVSIEYRSKASGAVLTSVGRITAEVLLLSEREPFNEIRRLAMTRSGEEWHAGFVLSNSPCVFFVRFVSDSITDDNGGHLWDVLIHAIAGGPARNAHAYRAAMYEQGGMPDFSCRRDSSRAVLDRYEEVRLHGDDPEIRVDHAWWLFQRTRNAAEERSVLDQIDSIYQQNRSRLHVARKILVFYDFYGMISASDRVRSDWREMDPQGLISRETRFKQIEHTPFNDTTMYTLLAGYVSDFPEPLQEGFDQRIREIYQAFHLVHLISNNEADEAIRIFEALPEKSIDQYMNIMSALASNGVDPERVLRYADYVLALVQDTSSAGHANQDGNPPTTMYDNSQLAAILLYRGMAFATLGRHVEALAAFKEAYKSSDSSDAWLNEQLLRSYLSNHENRNAVEFGLACIRNGVAGDSIPRILRREIGSKDVYPSKLDSLIEVALNDAGIRSDRNLVESSINIPSPSCNLKTMDGKEVPLTAFLGKVLVLDFWALWCSPCISSMPLLQKFHESVQHDPRIVVLSINVHERGGASTRRERVSAFINAAKYTFPVLFGDECYRALGLSGVPTLVLIDPAGRIQFTDTGNLLSTADGLKQLRRRIDLLLSESSMKPRQE